MCNSKNSAALERRVQVYPPPKYSALVKAMSKAEKISESEVVSTAIKDFFDRMPEDIKERLRTLSKHSY